MFWLRYVVCCSVTFDFVSDAILFCLLIVVLEEVTSSPLLTKNVVMFKLKEKKKVVEKLKCVKKTAPAAPAPAPPVYPSYTTAPPAPTTSTAAPTTTTAAPTTTTAAPTTTTAAPTTTTPAPTPYYG